jgi:AraC-like DNA-binding protein
MRAYYNEEKKEVAHLDFELYCREAGRDALTDVCHSHDGQLELIRVLSGRGKVFVGDLVLPFDGQCIFLIDGAKLHYVCPEEGVPYLRSKLVIEKRAVAHAPQLHLTQGVLYRVPSPERAAEIDREFARAGELCADGDKALLLLSTLFSILHLCTDTVQEQRTRYCGAVADVVTYIHDNLSEGITLTQVADALHINKHYLCRLFKRETGMTVGGYISSARIARAKQLLRTRQHSITYIAGECGFGDLSLFTKAFKKEMGMTPSAYRAR